MKKELRLNHIYCGDCVGIMQKEIPDSSIDLIVTSPPYNVGIKYNNWNDNLDEKKYWEFTENWINEIYRVLKKGGRICLNIPIMGNNAEMKKSNKYLFHLPPYLEILKSKLHLRECITWIKSYAEYDENVFCGNNTAWGSYLSPSNPFCRSFSEFIIIAHKDTPYLQHKGQADITKEEFLKYTKNVWFLPSENNRVHPAPFPKELVYRCIKLYSYVNDIILDPFIGSGTTAVVARDLKRNYIGIDISEKYVDMTNKRLFNTRKLF